MSQHDLHECLNCGQGSMMNSCGHLVESVVIMSDESKSIRGAEVEAWERCAEKYQFAYAFIRLRDSGRERDWINSFGELALERYTEQRALFVFFSDLEISIVTKILDQNVRVLNKDKTALEVLVDAWFQSAGERVDQVDSQPEIVSLGEGPVIASSRESEMRLFNSESVDASIAYGKCYQLNIEKLSLALIELANDLNNTQSVKNLIESFQALSDAAAQQGYLNLYLYLQNIQIKMLDSLNPELLLSRDVLESLRDCLTFIKSFVAAAIPSVHSEGGGFEPHWLTVSDIAIYQTNDASLFSPDARRLFERRFGKCAGELRINAIELKRFEEDLGRLDYGREVVERHVPVIGRIMRHASELQNLVNEFSSCSFSSLVQNSLNSLVFSRASVLLPLCCEIEGEEVRIQLGTANEMSRLIGCIFQYFQRLPDSFDFSQLCEDPLRISLRQSAFELTVCLSVGAEAGPWQWLVDALRDHFAQRRVLADSGYDNRPQNSLVLKFPIDSVTSQNLLVETAGERVALSSRSLLETGRVETSRVQKVGSKRFVPFRDGVIPLVSLSKALRIESMKRANSVAPSSANGDQSHSSEQCEFVIAKLSDDCIAFEVDAVVGQREMVVRDLNRIVPTFAGLLGVSVLEDERVSMVVDVAQLLGSDQMSRGENARKAS